MALRQPKLDPDDPRRKGHETTYQASRGGWFPAPAKPVPGTPKKEEK
jgi:hypothetical protein